MVRHIIVDEETFSKFEILQYHFSLESKKTKGKKVTQNETVRRLLESNPTAQSISEMKQ